PECPAASHQVEAARLVEIVEAYALGPHLLAESIRGGGGSGRRRRGILGVQRAREQGGQESPGGEVRAGRGSVPGGCVFHARCTAAPTRRVKRGGAKGPNLGPRDEIRPCAAPPAMESRAPVCQNRSK